jgi:hypothetical protein
MGNTNSKPDKANKEIKDERVLKIGLGVGKENMSLEGNFQFGWVRKTNKKYSKPKVSAEINGKVHDNPKSITEPGGDVLTGKSSDKGSEEIGETPL